MLIFAQLDGMLDLVEQHVLQVSHPSHTHLVGSDFQSSEHVLQH